MIDHPAIQQAVSILRAGGIIAYPTEGVFGFGCDPDSQKALLSLLALKNRAPEYGFILIASDLAQLSPYMSPLSDDRQQRILEADEPTTWLVPAPSTPNPLLTGGRATQAVRITGFAAIRDLCQAYGKPIVSTSANLSGQPPMTDVREIAALSGVDFVLPGPCGDLAKPTQIIDVQTGGVIRK